MDPNQDNAVVIVGAGLVGSLLAVLLAERGHAVTVYEKRPDLRETGAGGGRSINLVLTRRGIRALERVGLAEGALALTVPVTGRMMHPVEGELAYQPYGRDESECNYSISRGGLNEFLIREAARRGVEFRFRSPLVDADLDAGRLTFEDARAGRRRTVDAHAVFGADGAASAVRTAFRKLDGFEESVEMLEHGYKELTIPAGEAGGFRIAEQALHIWPRGDLMLMALPNLDGSFTVTLYLPYRGRHGFDALRTADDVLALFSSRFPDAIPLIPDLTESYFANPTGELGTVRCGPWNHGGRALLIGDASHAIVPFFGQGMNAGFEDCTVLDELLERHGRGDWEPVFAALAARRKPNADAIAAMALENFVEMRDRVGDPAFLLRKQVEHRLEREMPQEYRSRYSMVMYSHIPFDVALRAGRIQERILGELCEGLASADDLDLDLARTSIRERLAPFLREHGVSLDY